MNRNDAGLGGSAGAGAAAALLVVVLIGGAYFVLSPSDAPLEVVTAPEPIVDTVALSEDDVQQNQPPKAGDDAPEAQSTAPTFDTVRRDPDGATIIAGRAEPLSDVRILVNGSEIATVKADSTGGFAAFADLPARPEPQVLTLNAGVSGAEAVSDDQIILAPAPRPAPAPVALDSADAGKDDTSETSDAQVTAALTAGPATDPATDTPMPDPETPTAAPLPPAQPEQPMQEPVSPVETVLRSDAEGVSLLQTTPPQALSSIALDTIGYSALGEVQLSGRAQPQAREVRVYLDNRSVVSLPVDPDGRWRAELPDVDEGIYTLRVDEVTAAGQVSSRVETPFKRESAETLAQASDRVEGPISAVTVQKGATLWAIARERYGDGLLYVRVFEANADSIRDPDLIYPGQVFDLPD